MIPRRTRSLAGSRAVALALAALLVGVPRHAARADDPVVVTLPRGGDDPSPLSGGAPRGKAAEAAAERFDAVARDASARAFAREASAAAASEGGDAPAPPASSGRSGLGIAPRVTFVLDRLRDMDVRQTGVRLEPSLEVAHTIAGSAWEHTVDQPNTVLLGGRRPETNFFGGRFRPTSVDDLPPVLPIRVEKSTIEVPSPVAPPPAPKTAGTWTPADFVARGVLVGFDESAIRAAMAAGAAPSPTDAADAEDALLAAGDDEAAARAVLERAAAAAAAPRGDKTVKSVSLREQMGAAKGPEKAPRPFGGLARVVGAVLRPDGDVVVLGTEDAASPPLRLDDVVVALATVWRDGLTPGCSLDPEPHDPGGPQKVRVIGVPGDSAFALAMLEADYAMKRIVCGVDDPGVEGVKSLPDLAIGEPGELRSRFWLVPASARPGDLAVSPDGRSVLLSTRVEVRTERMVLAAAGEIGTSTTAPTAEAAAAALSEHYDAVARVRPAFARIEGLFDLVLLARALRVLAPEHPLLAEACALPREPVEVPASYAAVSATRANASGWITVTGGCEVSTAFERRVLRRLDDRDVEALETAARTEGASTLALPGAEAGEGPARDADLVAATMDLSRGALDEAIAKTDAILDRDPADARARALRAEAFRAAGRFTPALRDAEAAAALEPEDVEREALVVRVRMDREGAAALAGAPGPVRAAVAEAELKLAAGALSHTESAKALAAAERVLLADPRSYHGALVAAGASWLEDRLDDAERYATLAASLNSSETDPGALLALVRFGRRDAAGARTALDAALARKEVADLLGLRSLARVLEGDVPGAAADAEKALALAPRSDVAASAASAVEMTTRAPLDAVKRYVSDLFALPAKAMLGVGAAVAAAQEGRIDGAVLGYEQALAALDAAHRPPDVARTRIELAILGALPAAAPLLGRSREDVAARVEALAAGIEARGDAPITLAFSRAIARVGLGDREGAVARIEEACAAIGKPDVAAPEIFPGDAKAAEGLLRAVEMSILVSDGVSLVEGDRVPELLKKIAGILEGGAGGVAARAIGDYLAAVRAAPAAREIPEAVHASIATRLPEIEKAFAARAPSTADVVMATIYLGIATSTEAGTGRGELAETAARVLFHAPAPDVESPYARTLIPTIRAQAAAALQEMWTTDAARAVLLPSEPPKDEGELAVVAKALETVRAKAKAFGDPGVTLLVEGRFGRRYEDARRKVAEERRKKIERLLDVAEPGAKRDALQKTSDELAARIRAAESSRGDEIRALVARAYEEASTVAELRTLDKVVGEIAKDAGPDAPRWAVPADASLAAVKRSLEEARARGGKR